ncbi:hypothetical protein, partial [Frigidibacter sp. SD6-1]|uniref:hypothetical protein n=1 Tax=Frigidibacter sp. SD6-1 TaxID=3032581 RepID=UPI0024DFADAB
ITVVSAELDDRPTLVHNLEVAGAHTYFAGELEAWGHNKRSRTSGNNSAAQEGKKKHGELCEFLGPDWDFEVNLPGGLRADAVNFSTKTVVDLKPQRKRSRDYCQLARYVAALERKFGGKWTGIIMRYK